MLSVDHIYKTFNRFNILNGISFSQQEGEILALMGKNGSGKTTLLRIIARIMKPDSGSILFQGNELLSNNSLFRKNLLYIGHEPGMYSYLSAKENLRFALSFRYKSQPIAKIHKVLDRFELSRFSREPISVFSKGMLQRLKLAYVELSSWDLLLFDEPFTGLDKNGIDLVGQLIKKWRDQNKTVIMVLHNEHRAKQIADKKLLIDSGKIILD